MARWMCGLLMKIRRLGEDVMSSGYSERCSMWWKDMELLKTEQVMFRDVWWDSFWNII